MKSNIARNEDTRDSENEQDEEDDCEHRTRVTTNHGRYII